MNNYKKLSIALYSIVSLYLVFIIFSILLSSGSLEIKTISASYILFLILIILLIYGIIKHWRWVNLINTIIGVFALIGIVFSLVKYHKINLSDLILFIAALSAKIGAF